jgi:hypothetical protein
MGLENICCDVEWMKMVSEKMTEGRINRVVSVLKSGPVRFLDLFLEDRDRNRSVKCLRGQKTGLDRLGPVHIGFLRSWTGCNQTSVFLRSRPVTDRFFDKVVSIKFVDIHLSFKTSPRTLNSVEN